MMISDARLDKITTDQTRLGRFWQSHGGGVLSIAVHSLILLFILGGAWQTMPPKPSSVWVELQPAGISMGADSPSVAQSIEPKPTTSHQQMPRKTIESTHSHTKNIEHSSKAAKIITKRAPSSTVALPSAGESNASPAAEHVTAASGVTQAEKSGGAASGSADQVGNGQGVMGEGNSVASYRAQGLHNPAPAYPALSRERGETGRVVLLVEVSEQGQPQKIEIESSSGFTRLDMAAKEAVMRWRFLPAKRNGLAIVDQIRVPIRFREVE